MLMRIEPKLSIKAGRLVPKKESSLDSFDRASDDYFILIPIGSLVALSLVEFISLVKDSAPITHQILVLLLVIALSLCFYFNIRAIRRSYTLTWIATNLDKDVNRKLSRLAVESVGWELIEDYKTYLVAHTEASGFTWGQELTIIFDDCGIYANFRNRSHTLASARNPMMFGRGKKGLRRFSEELERLKGSAGRCCTNQISE
jgi:hypothetical protein